MLSDLFKMVYMEVKDDIRKRGNVANKMSYNTNCRALSFYSEQHDGMG